MAGTVMEDDANSLHDYVVLDEINDGGFSQVYKLSHRVTGHQYALKKIDIARTRRLGYTHCLARERRAARELIHSQRVVRIYSTFVTGDILNFIMELLPYGTFWDLTVKTEGLDIDAVQFYIAELVLALEYLRSMGWVHRDLKCENLLLDRNWHLKLADFGLAKKIGDPPGKPEENKPSTNVGTPMFKAPEVYSQKPTTFSTDLWGLGTCLYFMYMCRDPFSGDETPLLRENVMMANFNRLPRCANASIRDILPRLLTADDDKRLGADNLDELKGHQLFAGISWSTIHTEIPPETFPGERSHYQWYPRVPSPPPASCLFIDDDFEGRARSAS